jgi:hypothetical protein
MDGRPVSDEAASLALGQDGEYVLGRGGLEDGRVSQGTDVDGDEVGILDEPGGCLLRGRVIPRQQDRRAVVAGARGELIDRLAQTPLNALTSRTSPRVSCWCWAAVSPRGMSRKSTCPSRTVIGLLVSITTFPRSASPASRATSGYRSNGTAMTTTSASVAASGTLAVREFGPASSAASASFWGFRLPLNTTSCPARASSRPMGLPIPPDPMIAMRMMGSFLDPSVTRR